MNSRWRSALTCFYLTWSGALIGCSHGPPQLAPAEPPADAVQAVDLRARVTGYLVEMPFKEGAEVKKDDLLFVIDPRPYQAQLDQAEGQVNRYQAPLDLPTI